MSRAEFKDLVSHMYVGNILVFYTSGGRFERFYFKKKCFCHSIEFSSRLVAQISILSCSLSMSLSRCVNWSPLKKFLNPPLLENIIKVVLKREHKVTDNVIDQNKLRKDQDLFRNSSICFRFPVRLIWSIGLLLSDKPANWTASYSDCQK